MKPQIALAGFLNKGENMSKHTPGPWTASQFNKGERQRISGRNRQIAEVLANDPDSEANAALIAAAPELLEALKELDNAINEPSLGIDIIEASNNARKVITKAEGRE